MPHCRPQLGRICVYTLPRSVPARPTPHPPPTFPGRAAGRAPLPAGEARPGRRGDREGFSQLASPGQCLVRPEKPAPLAARYGKPSPKAAEAGGGDGWARPQLWTIPQPAAVSSSRRLPAIPGGTRQLQVAPAVGSRGGGRIRPHTVCTAVASPSSWYLILLSSSSSCWCRSVLWLTSER